MLTRSAENRKGLGRATGQTSERRPIEAAQPWRRRANELMAQARRYAYFPYPGSVEIQKAMNTALNSLLEGKQGPDATLRDMRLQAENVMREFME
ncbi:MAG: hypothetical protein HY332_00940 [Chloroflexi bacterium]|nr:hypothetical protein [Chloroflexota bacterium]